MERKEFIKKVGKIGLLASGAVLFNKTESYFAASKNQHIENRTNLNMSKFEIIEIIGDYRSGFVNNSSFGTDTKIHFIEKNHQRNDKLSLMFSPGVWEPAERAIPLFEGLDCHSVSLSYRGRGKSDTPSTGYDLHHHVMDFSTVADALISNPFVIVAFSRGVGYACGYVSARPEKVKGLIIVDHPPIHVKPQPGYADYWKNLVYLGHPLTKYMRPEALDGLQREANEVVFWNQLSKLTIPVTVLRGVSKKCKIASELTDEDMSKYRKHIKNYNEINFEYSGHMIVDEELGKYREVVKDFVSALDK